MSERWLTFEEAVEIVRARMDASIGRSEAMLKAARASGEVRFQNPADPVLLLADDGLVGMNLRPGAQDKAGVTADGKSIAHRTTSTSMFQISEDDLLDWLGRQTTEALKPEPAKPRTQTKRTRVCKAIQALWPSEIIPDQSVLSNSLLCKKVGDWLKADCQKQNVPVAIPSDDTILRAAGRK